MSSSKWALPHFFTLCNLFCGILAVVYSLNDKMLAAAWLIIIAGLLDGLDGKVARFTGSSTRFGVEFDSMADLISFGIAPGVLIHKWYFHSLDVWGWFILSGYIAAGAFRLARFNYQFQGHRKESFRGLPITMAGMTMASYSIFSGETVLGDPASAVLLVLTLSTSLLMVSTIRYEGLPQLRAQSIKGKAKILVLLGVLVAVIIDPSAVLFPVMAVYILMGPFEWGLRSIHTHLNGKNREHTL